ncbi:hypothetical protein [Longimicrobium sp.]|jgi:hypothetical protein|uniref:hypothetical protein n=1 Tax=Longimicrobium sp. TaxID=2029185 RepID=UPI002ED82E56
MKKLRLQLEDLRIDSFSTTPVEKEKGTVFGEQCTCNTACSCPGCPTCDASCNGTCAATCDASCNGTCDYSCNTCGGSCGAGDSCYQTCALYSGCTPYACW